MGGVIAPQRPRLSVAAVVFWAAGILLGTVKLVTVVATPDPWKLLAFGSDDVHYYLLTALHAAVGDGSTFDGLQPTNGYQPLWFLLLTGLFRVLGVDRSGGLVVTMALLVVLWAVALWLVWRIAAVTSGPAGALAALVVLLPHARWWGGCENALVAVLLLALVDVVLRRRLLDPVPDAGSVRVAGVLLALLALGRLDCAVLVGLFALVGWWRWRSLRLLVPLVAPAVVSLAVYAGLDEVLLGSALPVSGLAKQLGSGGNWGAIGQFLLYGSLGPLPMFFGLAVLVLAAVAWTPAAAELRVLIVLLVLAQLIQVAWYVVTTPDWELQSWYFSTGTVALVLSATVIGGRLASVRFAAPVVAGLAVLVLLVFAGKEAVQVLPRDPSSSPYTRDVDAGQWADRTLPPGAVLAMGDWAGSFAASTQHPVVQLEGLVGSPAYLAALSDGHGAAYLRSLGVRYYARLLHPGEALSCRPAEPWFGNGPKLDLDLCGRPIVYRGDVRGAIDLVVWDLR
ncbi:hypothetical protein [Actinomycetospora chiangmaiensis]|uniref:hypothetical protein n=1 Tax=Actinomycetospora chiangmaiensis TaxID=402650 RepID=UPI00035E7C91|nr:hypothetical protein [Actinomycetospora chiangmaiensis]